MKEKTWNWLGAVWTAVVGSLLHFLYGWAPSGFTATLGAVNESTWEHMKLAFWPMLLFGIAEYIAYGKKKKGFLPLRICSILMAVLLIPILFYSYTGALGTNSTPVNLLIFYGSVLVAYLFSSRQLQKPWKGFCTLWAELLSYGILLLMLIAFLSFTKNPPILPLFRDPISGGYGVVPSAMLM